jgi:FkbM family methyltransferase
MVCRKLGNTVRVGNYVFGRPFAELPPKVSMIKPTLQRILRVLGLYVWFKEESFAYDVYRRHKDGRPITWRSQELRFYRGLLGGATEGLLIFDVGANRGQKTDVFLRLGARVVAAEPDESNRRLLERKYRGRLWNRPVTIVGKAVSDSAGAGTLWVTAPGSGLNTLSEKWVRTLAENPGKLGSQVEFADRRTVETTTLAALMESHGEPRYIKIDVEGHEPQVLRGLARAVPFVSFEANLPEFMPEAVECIGILGRLSPGGRFNLSERCYRGLDLARWQSAPEITAILGSLGERTVEVFWRRE